MHVCRFLGKVCMKQSRVLSFGQNQVRPPKEGSAAEPLVEAVSAAKACPRNLGLSSLEARFGRRRLSFVSGRDFRLPKVPPNMHEFCLWRGVSATEPAAESALFSLPLHDLCDCFKVF